MNYHLYNPISNKVRSGIKKMMREENQKPSENWQREWWGFLSNGVLHHDVNTPVVILEQDWLENPVCLLPESSALVEQISNVNFEGQVNSIRPPYEQFSIAIPKQTTFNGDTIKGVFVSFLDITRKNIIAKNFSNKYTNGAPCSFNDGEDNINPNRQQMCIAYEDPNGNGNGAISSNIWVDELHDVLNSATVNDFSEKTKRRNTKDGVHFFGLNDNEKATQFELLKFIVGFVIYVSAHNDRISLITNIKMPQSSKGTPLLRVETVKEIEYQGGKRPHYRNLRHERFYQGEFSDWVRGSRWIPVKMNTSIVES